MAKLIIGITGPVASGKDTAANYLKQKGFAHVSLSQIIRAEARRQNITTTRKNLIKLGNQLRRAHGPAVLAQFAIERVKRKNKIVVTSIRSVAEVEHLRKSGKFVLVKLTADPQLRLRRLKRRGRKDERWLTLAQMQARERLEQSNDPNALQLHKVMAMADKIIEDNGTKEALYQKIKDFQTTLE